MKPWLNNDGWFEKYALGITRLKRSESNLKPFRPYITKSIRSTFRRVFRAVAFDIDGTLTEPNSPKINKKMSIIVGSLLQRGVPVLLVTGRGRGSAREAAYEIKRHSGLSDWYLRRLQCITHNGVFLLHTPAENPSDFLRSERIIEATNCDVDNLYPLVDEEIKRGCFNSTIVTKEPRSIRIVIYDDDEVIKLEKALLNMIKTSKVKPLFLSRGSYSEQTCLDLSATNKLLGLDRAASLLGIDPSRILRIGDQGQEGGNDFDLLNNDAGFSVGQFSKSSNRCLPVLSEDMKTPLKGVSATKRLLDLVLLFPSLSISPEPRDIRIRDHRKFEKLALIRSREETDTVTQRLRVRLRYMLPDGTGFSNPHTMEISDIYDMRSGGVIVREWELDDIPRGHSVLRLFDVREDIYKEKELRSEWCMYTDTGILMRGPRYYYGQTAPTNQRNLKAYLTIANAFLKNATEVVKVLSQEDVDLTRYKLALAIYDNVRNILLQILYISFVVEGNGKMLYKTTGLLFKTAVLRHTEHHFNLLLNADADWTTLLSRYEKMLIEILAILKKAGKSLIPRIDKLDRAQWDSIGQLFKWRECDNFLQNIAAVQLGLHELRQRANIRDATRLAAVGLAYGGTELPAIAQVVAKSRSFPLDAALAKVSIYGDRAASEKIRAGKYQYVAELLDKTKPLCLIDGDHDIRDTSFILMDDNCTTGVTLQLARDFLVMQGADVLGAIIVRFPGVNRHSHMSMSGHGFPDPEVLFSFVRGLIAPSPYTRLIFPRKGKDPYLDQTKVFDKARERIERYLRKNGTPIIKSDHEKKT